MKWCYPDGGGDGGGTRRGGRDGNGSSSSSSSYLMDDTMAKFVKEKKETMLLEDAGDDELLAALGYNVSASKMEDVAQKLEQLEMAMAVGGSGGFGFGCGIPGVGGGRVGFDDSSIVSRLASEIVHYNPSDVNSWLENMLSELYVPPPPAAVAERIGFSNTSSHLDDLTAIVPGATRENKRRKSSTSTSPTSTSAPPPLPTTVPPPIVLMEESQEAGICLVHALLGCAEAVHQGNRPLAETLINQITLLAISQGGAMRKVSTCFAEALARRIYPIHPSRSQSDPQPSDLLEMHFYEAYPYLKFAHFTANQAILEAFADKSKVHVIDFGIKQGMQWPALIQALALRPGGPPFFRLTGIGPGDSSNALQEVGRKLAQFAESLNVKFEYNEFATNSLDDLEPYMFDIAVDTPSPSSYNSSAVAVNSILEFHRLLGSPGSFEKVLNTVKSLKPAILTVVEQEANHNGPVFLDRFTEALHYYSSMFDSLEGGVVAGTDSRDQVKSEEYMGRQICDVVACEGGERKERHETADKWKERFISAGFQMAPLGSNAYRQASILLEVFAGGDGYRIEEKDGFLMLDWHIRPLFTASAWRLPSSSSSTSSSAGVSAVTK